MGDSPDGRASQPFSRCCLRYSLRTLLLGLTLACVGAWYWFRVPFEQRVDRPLTRHEIAIVGTGLPLTDPFRDPFGSRAPPMAHEQRQFRRSLFGEPIRHGETTSFFAESGKAMGK